MRKPGESHRHTLLALFRNPIIEKLKEIQVRGKGDVAFGFCLSTVALSPENVANGIACEENR